MTSGSIEHFRHIDIVLNKLQTAGLTCNIKKCQFICTEVKMLGHIITTDGIKTDPEKLESIKEFSIPKKVKHLRAFLGLCNYYRRFIPNYSTLIQPLCKLLKKDYSWQWNGEAQVAFDIIKHNFLETIMLHHPDISKPYYLQTDSSGIGLGGVLYQYDGKDQMKIIGFCSKSLRGAELRWTVTEQEFWAVIYCLRKFETYLRGGKVIIRTDHKALTFVKTWKLYNSRIIRWTLFLEQFNYEVEHIKGKDNIVSDILSRFPPHGNKVQELKQRCPEICYMESRINNALIKRLRNLKQEQYSDDESRKLLALVKNVDNNFPGRLSRIARRCLIKDELLYFVDNIGSNILYLPKNQREDVIKQTHVEMGHQGAYKVIRYLKC